MCLSPVQLVKPALGKVAYIRLNSTGGLVVPVPGLLPGVKQCGIRINLSSSRFLVGEEDARPVSRSPRGRVDAHGDPVVARPRADPLVEKCDLHRHLVLGTGGRSVSVADPCALGVRSHGGDTPAA